MYTFYSLYILTTSGSHWVILKGERKHLSTDSEIWNYLFESSIFRSFNFSVAESVVSDLSPLGVAALVVIVLTLLCCACRRLRQWQRDRMDLERAQLYEDRPFVYEETPRCSDRLGLLTEDGEAATPGATAKKGKKKGKKGKKWDTQLGVDVNDVKAVQDLIAKEVGC